MTLEVAHHAQEHPVALLLTQFVHQFCAIQIQEQDLRPPFSTAHNHVVRVQVTVLEAKFKGHPHNPPGFTNRAMARLWIRRHKGRQWHRILHPFGDQAQAMKTENPPTHRRNRQDNRNSSGVQASQDIELPHSPQPIEEPQREQPAHRPSTPVVSHHNLETIVQLLRLHTPAPLHAREG